jgi:hypothetical protein
MTTQTGCRPPARRTYDQALVAWQNHVRHGTPFLEPGLFLLTRYPWRAMLIRSLVIASILRIGLGFLLAEGYPPTNTGEIAGWAPVIYGLVIGLMAWGTKVVQNAGHREQGRRWVDENRPCLDDRQRREHDYRRWAEEPWDELTDIQRAEVMRRLVPARQPEPWSPVPLWQALHRGPFADR